MNNEPSRSRGQRDLRTNVPAPPGKQASIGELVEHLFATTRKENGRPYTNEEVCDWIRTHVPDADTSPSYIARIRRGLADNPSREVLRNLCLFFGVEAAYFFPELSIFKPKEDSDRAVAVALRTLGVDPALTPYVHKILQAMSGSGRDESQE